MARYTAVFAVVTAIAIALSANAAPIHGLSSNSAIQAQNNTGESTYPRPPSPLTLRASIPDSENDAAEGRNVRQSLGARQNDTGSSAVGNDTGSDPDSSGSFQYFPDQNSYGAVGSDSGARQDDTGSSAGGDSGLDPSSDNGFQYFPPQESYGSIGGDNGRKRRLEARLDDTGSSAAGGDSANPALGMDFNTPILSSALVAAPVRFT